MAIKYKIIQRGEPGVVGGGVLKYYASAISSGERDIDSLTRSIEKISTVSGADIHAVLYSFIDVMTEDLSNGQIVRLGNLGSLRVSISSNGYDTAEEVNRDAIRAARIIFTPGAKLKDMLKNLKYSKV